MGLISYSESETSLSAQDERVKTREKETTRDVIINRTVLSPDKFPLVYNGLLKYGSGSNITVEYFNNVVNYLEKQTSDFTLSLFRSDVDISYDLIKNMEIILTSSLDESFNDETGEFNISGEGIVYPKIYPKVGDIFLYRLLDNLIGVFVIDDIKRLTLSKETAYNISFHLYSYLDDDISNKLYNNVKTTYYFSKEKYVNTNTPILRKDTYVKYVEIKHQRRKLYHHWINNYYNDTIGSVINKLNITVDNVEKEIYYYDPYLIEFVSNIFDISEFTRSKSVPIQLLGNLVDRFFEGTIWNSLLKKDPFYTKYKFFVTGRLLYRTFNVTVSSVVGTNIVLLGDKNDISSILEVNDNTKDTIGEIIPYVFSNDFYTLISSGVDDLTDVSNLSDLEILLLKYLNTDDTTTMIDDIIEFITNIPSESNISNFYRYPILIMMSNIALGLMT